MNTLQYFAGYPNRHLCCLRCFQRTRCGLQRFIFIRGCSFFTLHTRSDDFCPGYETFSGFSHRARNIFQIPLPGYETFLPKIIFRGTKHFCHLSAVWRTFRNIGVNYYQYGGVYRSHRDIGVKYQKFGGVQRGFRDVGFKLLTFWRGLEDFQRYWGQLLALGRIVLL